MTSEDERCIEWYRVFKPERDTAAHDPLDPEKRYHDGIFIETDPTTGRGTMLHVTGDVIAARGMRFERLDNVTPSGPGRLHNIVMLGWLCKIEHDSDRVDAILRALPTPPKQQGINFWEKNSETGRYDLIWTKQNGDPYEKGETPPPTFKCNEWTAPHAIPALRTAGILCD